MRCVVRTVKGRDQVKCSVVATPKSVVRARLSRAGTTYAEGRAVVAGGVGRLRMTGRRAIPHGAYTLTLHTQHDGRWSATRLTVTV